MTDEIFDIQLDYTTKPKPVPCPNCKAKLDRKTVMSDHSPNVGRPYVACETCADNGKISFWFLDHGECDECGCPLFQNRAKKGQHVGRQFEACSQGCPGKFCWLD